MCAPTCATDIDALPHPSKWPHRPIYLVADDRVKVNGFEAGQPLPLGKHVDFETDLFKGRFFLRLRHVKPHDEDSDKSAAYFDGKKRFYQLVIQGKFKDGNLTFSDVVVGDVYERQLKGVPHGKLGRLMKRFVESISPGIIFDIFDDKQPKVLAPLGGCQTVSVDLPGQEPSNFDNLSENTTLLFGRFASKEERKNILSRPRTAAQYKVDTEHIYTFESYDHTMDFGTFHQHFYRGFKVDLVPSLDGQSLSLGMFTRQNLICLYKFSLWHERGIEKHVESAR
ncbi:hypothetical protein ACHAXR_001535 [Thalassiosira sp. AJA248-18]